MTALIQACGRGQSAVVKLLLANPETVDVNQGTTDNGFTETMWACQGGHAAVVELLLAHAAVDVNQGTTGKDHTALMLARGHAAVVDHQTKAGWVPWTATLLARSQLLE
jgi:ankyrin repeat protein